MVLANGRKLLGLEVDLKGWWPGWLRSPERDLRLKCRACSLLLPVNPQKARGPFPNRYRQGYPFLFRRAHTATLRFDCTILTFDFEERLHVLSGTPRIVTIGLHQCLLSL